jgi:vancomycin resistance protein YoaR
VGFILSAAILAGAVLFYFQHSYKNRVIPGIFIDDVYVGEKSEAEIEQIFNEKNSRISKNIFVFSAEGLDATVSAETLNVGYDVDLITEQSLNLGKSKNVLSDVYLILSSYINGTFLKSSYTFNEDKIEEELDPIQQKIYIEPSDAQFNVVNNRVVAFQESSNGKTINFDELRKIVRKKVAEIMVNKDTKLVRIDVPITILEPNVTTEEANDLGIVEPIGVGKSTFIGSIPNRVHNISLASSRLNGILVAPGEEFSFAKAIGDVSRFTGYKEAFVIQSGRTVLGDGGGVCQVSTTLFRAILNSGLPITERHPHAYRVGYYEQDAPPGLDATVYVPSVDLRFKNDTEKHVLIQSYVDPTNMALTFTLYGKSDGRQTTITKPVISNASSPPEPLYQDDPNLPVGTLKQVDFAAPGGKAVFSRKVTRDGQVIIEEAFASSYRPWQAVFLRGTKQ